MSKVNFLSKLKFGLKARISLYERIQAFLEAGIDIINTLESIRDRYKKSKDGRYKILDNWLETMSKGGKFSDAIRPWVPPAEHMLIAAGERGEGLISGLSEATVLSNAAAKNKGAIIGGLVMPIFLISMIFGMLAAFQLKMAPVFVALLPVDQWPDNAQTLYGMSKFITDYWFIVLSIFIVLAVIISYTMGRWVGTVRNKIDILPPWSLYKNYQSSSFLIGFSSLMKAGIANYDALKTMHRTASPWMQAHLEQMMAAMKLGGSSSGEALDTGLLDKETAGDVQDYSRLGSFEKAIYILGERSLTKSVERTNARMAVLRNVLLVVVALGIITIYGTTYSLQSQIADQQQAGR